MGQGLGPAHIALHYNRTTSILDIGSLGISNYFIRLNAYNPIHD